MTKEQKEIITELKNVELKLHRYSSVISDVLTDIEWDGSDSVDICEVQVGQAQAYREEYVTQTLKLCEKEKELWEKLRVTCRDES